ncbi:FtsK/SpoIIIE domain-containing protein [Pullulanibacillus sp. KACC 23026]|uniref:FtsK/SpoIIIE domain-containing protein n=1 Tax=Pullulanibacillus sp. KACC 23026 TaxID=3028315 RepID=UPI0023AF787F|nr:FtsK/SpoIIIE domain-containing protein [Pullulanibacillus sp. KACC 23026]WEG14193.1 FtsK/SpoIIIE domain-containing protein [Pullulanibacillus sp. KACC 23026]
MINLIAGSCLIALTYYWIRSYDKNVSKLKKVFENCGLKAGDQIPMFSKKRGNVYLFRLPPGLTADAVKDKKAAFEDAFPDKAIDISFKKALRILITDPLPESIPYDESEAKGWSIPFGKDLEKVIRHNFSHYPHLLVAGMTRYGKSVLLSLIICMLLKFKPNKTKLVLIDLKGGLELNQYSKLKQCKAFAKNVDEAYEVLKQLKREVETRQKIFLQRGYKKIEEAKEPFERVFIIIDEAAQLNSHGIKGDEGKMLKECERLLAYCAQIGAGMGYHLIYATQYPTMQTLPQQVKNNCDARISFQLGSGTASRVVFDETDKAEKLPHIRGRAIYRTDKDVELQVFKMTDQQVMDIIEANKREEDDPIGPSDSEDNERGADTFYFE